MELDALLGPVIAEHKELLSKLKADILQTVDATVDMEHASDSANSKKCEECMPILLEAERLLNIHIQALTDARRCGQDEVSKWYTEHVTQLLDQAAPLDEYIKKHAKLKSLKQQAVQHPNEPMPGEDEDIMVAPSAVNQFVCPITKAPFVNPMRNTKCGHVYSHDAIMQMLHRKPYIACPVAGCAGNVTKSDLEHDDETEHNMKRNAGRVQASQTQDDTEYTML